MKKSIIKILVLATLALIVPLLGNTFVSGWNWTWHDFLFAWVFWVVMALVIMFTVRRYPQHKNLLALAVFVLFAAIWVRLATG